MTPIEYPITPAYLDRAPENLIRLYSALGSVYLEDMVSRLVDPKQEPEGLEASIKRMRILGYDTTVLEEYVETVYGLAETEIDRIMTDCSDLNSYYYGIIHAEMDLSYSTYAIQAELDAIRAQTKGEILNLTRSLGFAIRDTSGQLRWGTPAETYQRALDRAELSVWRGEESLQVALRESIRDLTDSGLQWVDYETGHRNRVDVAVRRAVVTGLSQMSATYAQEAAQTLQTDLWEITAHIGARDVCRDPLRPWQDHKSWQGKWYSERSDSAYPSIYEICGLGEVDGLMGANCRHLMHPVIEGVSQRTYTDEELEQIDPDPIEYEGTEYSAYQARQYQRQIETAIRAVKRRLLAYKESGDETQYAISAAKYQRLTNKYTEFCKAANLTRRDDRCTLWQFGPSDHRDAIKAIKLP